MSASPAKVADNNAVEDRLYRYRAKRLRFLINGDKYFTGINYALNTEKIRSFDALLNDLNRALTGHIKLCNGARYIFAMDGHLVLSLNEFQDGCTYICSSIDTFNTIDYPVSNGMLNWLVRNSACISSSSNVRTGRKLVNKSNNNNNTTTTTGTPSTSILNNNSSTTTRMITVTSHNNSGAYLNNVSNNISQQHHNHPSPRNNLHHTPINNNSNKKLNPNSYSVSTTKIPMRAIDSRISQKSNSPHNKNSTKSIKTNLDDTQLTNNLNLDKQRVQSKSNFGFEIMEKYDIGTPIGDGHFSVVYCCMNKASREFCALKLIDKLKCLDRNDMIYNEVKILKQLNHPNIVKLKEEFDYPEELYLILELVQDGDLFDAITAVTKFNEVHVATMIHNLSSALSYLHRHGIVHRDIKPENLLISVQEDGSQSLKLADFGLAVEVGDSLLYSVCGTAFYVSPEMLTETGYDYKVDVWSAGVICFILLCGYPPFTSEDESDQDELFDAILAGELQFAPPYWSKISQHAKNLIKSMLTVDPKQRYTAEQVFKHHWTNGLTSNFDGINPMNISRKIALQVS